MVNKKPDEQSLSELIDTAKQIALLIEDNNQNIKDCSAILRQIQKKICPPPQSLSQRLRLAIRNLLNKK